MPIKLKVFKQKWICSTRDPDECKWPKKFSPEKIVEVKSFTSYVKMADWLDEHKQLANHVMLVSPMPSRSLTGIRKVVFDGADTWVERYGHV